MFLLPTGYQLLYQSPTSLDCHGLLSVRYCVGDQFGQVAQGAYFLSRTRTTSGGLRQQPHADVQLLFPLHINLTILKGFSCTTVLEHQSL